MKHKSRQRINRTKMFDDNPVDYQKIRKVLRDSESSQSGLVVKWNELTNYYLPRVYDAGKLKELL